MNLTALIIWELKQLLKLRLALIIIERGKRMFFQTIIDEMAKGNFSFLILVVGALQLGVMIYNAKKKK